MAKRKRTGTSGLIKEMEEVLLLVCELSSVEQKDIARVIGYHVLAIEDCATMTEEQHREYRRLQAIRRRAEADTIFAELRRRLGRE